MGQTNRAVVLGSGMAGLVTARVLSDHFAEVLVIEKDSEQQSAGFRPGIPQGRHFHALIPGGLDVMEKLMPGLKADLRAAGSLLPKPDQFYFYMPEGKSYAQGVYQPVPPGEEHFEPAYVQTRGLLEFTVRQRISSLGNVSFRYDTTVREPVVSEGRVTGVQVDKTDETVSADVVIDAMGKTGRSSNWLAAMGYQRPQENVINCDFAYTSVFLEPDDPDAFTDVGFFVMPAAGAELFRGGALVRMEDGSWLALVGGRYGDYPPRDFEGFLEYAKTLAEPRFYDLVSQAKPLYDPAHFRFPSGVRRRFDLLSEFPEGLLPIGDSVCHFNPAYGQGMTSASLQAMALNQVLATQGGWADGVWREAFASIFEVTRAPWLFAATADFMHPKCTGDFPQEEHEALAALGSLRERSAAGDPDALRLLMGVSMLKLPLSAILPGAGADGAAS